MHLHLQWSHLDSSISPLSSSNEVKCGINNYTSLTRRTPALQYRQRSGAKVIFNKSHFLRTRSMQLTCHNVLLGGNIFCLLKQQNDSKLNFRNVTFLCGKVCSYLVLDFWKKKSEPDELQFVVLCLWQNTRDILTLLMLLMVCVQLLLQLSFYQLRRTSIHLDLWLTSECFSQISSPNNPPKICKDHTNPCQL